MTTPGATEAVTPEPHKEYLRRNLIHAASIGVHAGTAKALERLRSQSRPAKWLLTMLAGVLERAAKAPPELARWRNEAPDAPAHARSLLPKEEGQAPDAPR